MLRGRHAPAPGQLGGRRWRGRLSWLSIAALPLMLAAPDAAGPAADPFPTPAGLVDQVEFWTRVFAEWRADQIAVHDMDYPAIVYEVAPLAGPTEFPYTEEQQQRVDELREGWQQALRDLQGKLDRGEQLSEHERGLRELVVAAAGEPGLEQAAERVRTQRGLRERFHRGLEISPRYEARFREIFREAGLPEDLAYLPHVESSFRTEARSSAGAAGIWQFTRGTGRQFLVVSSAFDGRLDPIAATRGAAAYFARAFDLLGDWPLAVTSYNHGMQGMLRAKSQFGADLVRIRKEYNSRAFGFASRNFYAEFLAARAIARDPQRHFREGLTGATPLELESTVWRRRATAAEIAREFDVALERLAELNPAWTRRALEGSRLLPAGITVWLPPGTLERYAVRAPVDLHVVARGETLSGIASRYGVALADLRSWNDLAPSESMIRPGQRLSVRTPATLQHRVRRGETLSEIAERYGLSMEALRRLNGIPRSSSLIRAGQVLRVGHAEPELHVVRRGDTLIEIAAEYGVRLADLLSLNRLTVRAVIYPGQQLRIPLPY